MTQEEIKTNFSQNLIRLRKENKLTQLALAEKLNYSDKAVSKWEVGSVVPDVETLTHIADFFGITVNDLIYPEKKKIRKIFWKNHLFITLISLSLCWFLAATTYLIIEQAGIISRPWLIFTNTIIISMIILVVFSSIWFNKLSVILSVSGILWSIILNVFLIINDPSLWFIFIVGVVGQLIIIFWAQIRKIVIPEHAKQSTRAKEK